VGVRKKGFSFIFIPVGLAARLSAALLVEPSCGVSDVVECE
jgi:hypothetical protein